MELPGPRRLVQANSSRLPQIWHRHLLPPSVSPPCARSIAAGKAVDQGLSRLAGRGARSSGGAGERYSPRGPAGKPSAPIVRPRAENIRKSTGNILREFTGNAPTGGVDISRALAENSIRDRPEFATVPIPHHGTAENDRAAPGGGGGSRKKGTEQGKRPRPGYEDLGNLGVATGEMLIYLLCLPAAPTRGRSPM